MKILVVGSGGREHAIIHKISKSKKVEKIYCAPGNDGIGQIAELVPIPVMEFDSLIKFAKEKEIDLVVASMDDTLVAGIVDKFEENGIRIFGPNKACAIIEGSKAFSKELMKKYNIPTAKYETFTEYEKALEYIKSSKTPIVIKADGLAFGKGVIICESLEDAQNAIKEIMVDKKFGDSGNSIVIEEFMTGPEVSVLCFCDGKDIVPMVSAQDHKRAFDGDKGLNTGGMGTISPTRFYTEEISETCMQKIYKPTMDALIKEGRPFKGVIFFGLMITEDGPKVIEYNARFGDPETQVVLPRLKTDLVEIMEACVDGKLADIKIEWEDNATVCVILASGGYPSSFNKGYEITGLENFKSDENVYIYHAGTKLENGKYVTNGGRVLGVMAKGENMEAAKKLAYESVSKINFENMHFRKDIGNK